MPTNVDVPFTQIEQVTDAVIFGSIFLVVLTLVVRFSRLTIQPPPKVVLARDGGPEMSSTSALSMLDGFNRNDQPHASPCAGRGRCGTCAVRVVRSEFPLPQPSELEQRTLLRVGAPEGTRLACQLQPAGGKVDVQASNVQVLPVNGQPKSLLELPQRRLGEVRKPLLKASGHRFQSPNKVALYLFDDGSWVIENFNDQAITVQLDGQVHKIAARGWKYDWQ